MEFSWKPNAKCSEPHSSISAHPSAFLSFSKISQPSGYNQQNGKQCCLPPLYFKVSLKGTSVSSVSRMLVKYSLNCILHHCIGKAFQFMVFTFLQIAVYIHFYSCPSSTLKTLGTIFWKSVSVNKQRKIWFALSKFNQKIWRWLGTSGY